MAADDGDAVDDDDDGDIYNDKDDYDDDGYHATAPLNSSIPPGVRYEHTRDRCRSCRTIPLENAAEQ